MSFANWSTAAVVRLSKVQTKGFSCSHKFQYRTEQQHIKAAAAITHYITMFYTAAITKQSKNQPIGIGLEDTDYGIAISSINPEGPLSQTSLKPGLKLLIINNIEVSGLSPKEVGKILNNVGDKLVLSA